LWPNTQKAASFAFLKDPKAGCHRNAIVLSAALARASRMAAAQRIQHFMNYFTSLHRAFFPYFIACLLLASAAPAQQTSPPQQSPPQQTSPPPPTTQQQSGPAADPHAAEERAAQRQALGFLGYLDAGRYSDGYAYTSKLIRRQMGQAAFAKNVQKDRAPLGAKQTRKLLDATYTTSLQGQPAGQYVVLQYNSDFADKKGAVETLVLSFESGYWRVAGWFVK
jgi:Protein of unknown function (DUF4019)